MSNIRFLTTAALAALFVVGCGDDDDKNDKTPVEQNTAPIAALDAPASIELGGTVELDASASSDADGDALTFQWSLTAPEGSAAALASESGETNTFVADVAGTYSITVTVDDGELQDSATAGVEAADETVENTAPVADAGSNATVSVGEAVVLDGSASSDADGDTLTYTWTFTAKPEGSSASFDEAGAPKPTFTPDVVGAYTVSLVVNDGEADSEADTVSVEATNEAPVVDAGADLTATVGQTVELTADASDADGHELTYAWSFDVTPGEAPELTGADSDSASFVAAEVGTYTLVVSVDDGWASATDSVSVVVSPALPTNNPPVAAAGDDFVFNIAEGEAIELDGTGSTDIDGDELTYAWTIEEAPEGSEAELQDATSAEASIIPDLAGSWTFLLTVSDGELEATDSVVVTVNTPPTAVAGADQTVEVGTEVTLDASGSSDADGDSITFTWTVVDAPETVTFADPNQATQTFTANEEGDYVFQLEVADDDAVSADTVTVSAGAAAPAFCFVISEYVEGSSNNKALELYNCGTQDITLDDYELCNRANDAESCNPTELTGAMGGTLAAGEVIVYCNNQANADVKAVCDVETSAGFVMFNGDDAVFLRETATGSVIDQFGQLDRPSGTPWANMTLRRECNLAPYDGTADFSDSAVYETYYMAYPQDDFSGLGVAPVCNP